MLAGVVTVGAAEEVKMLTANGLQHQPSYNRFLKTTSNHNLLFNVNCSGRHISFSRRLALTISGLH
jgi:hypothetical protein